MTMNANTPATPADYHWLDTMLDDALGLEALITAHSPVIDTVPAHVGAKPSPVTYTEVIAHQWAQAVAVTLSGAAR